LFVYKENVSWSVLIIVSIHRNDCLWKLEIQANIYLFISSTYVRTWCCVIFFKQIYMLLLRLKHKVFAKVTFVIWEKWIFWC